jgi:hypothetical protein
LGITFLLIASYLLGFNSKVVGSSFDENGFLEKFRTTQTSYYRIRVKEGEWVEYKIAEILGKAIIPIEFKTLFPRVWISLNENTSIIMKVLDKRVVGFGNYSREFAIINVTVNGQPVIPFWLFEMVKSIKQLPLDGYSPFMPVDESYWDDFRELVKFWANQVTPYGFQITYSIQKCFYRLRVDHMLIGWVEVSAIYDDYYGVLKEFSIAFALTQSFIEEINRKIGTIIVNNKPFQFEAGKLYRVKIVMVDTNIPSLVNSVEFGNKFADALNKALEDGFIGVLITLKNRTLCRFEVVSPEMNTTIPSITSDKIMVKVNSESPTGKVLIFNVPHDVFPIHQTGELQVLVDGERAMLADDYNDALNPFNEDKPEYFVLVSSKLTQVVVSIPHFSTHIIEIVRVQSPAAQYPLYIGIGVIACILLILLVRRIGKHG